MQSKISVQKRGSCYGCGAEIQTQEPGSVGYMRPDAFEAKAKHRQMDQLFCRWACGQTPSFGNASAIATRAELPKLEEI